MLVIQVVLVGNHVQFSKLCSLKMTSFHVCSAIVRSGVVYDPSAGNDCIVASSDERSAVVCIDYSAHIPQNYIESQRQS